MSTMFSIGGASLVNEGSRSLPRESQQKIHAHR